MNKAKTNSKPNNRLKQRPPQKKKNQTKRRPKQKKQLQRPLYVPRARLSGYKASLLYPEINMAAQVPNMVPCPTVPLHREVMIQIATNAQGNMGWSWSPQLLSDNTAKLTGTTLTLSGCTNSTLVTAGTYSLTGSSTSIGQVVSCGIIADTIKAYRLVSACVEIEPLGNVLQNSGYMAVGVVENINVTRIDPTVAAATDLTIPLTSNLKNQKYHAVANINRGEKVRCIWLPNEIDDFEFYKTNEGQYANANSANTSTIAGTIIGTTNNGTPASTVFNMKISLNYECIPVAGTNQSGQETMSRENSSPHAVIREIRLQPERIAACIKS